jgi:hypothetical protein
MKGTSWPSTDGAWYSSASFSLLPPGAFFSYLRGSLTLLFEPDRGVRLLQFIQGLVSHSGISGLK